MQRYSRMGIVVLALAGVLAGAAVVLMTVSVPSPMRPIEKELDAKAFLAGKQ